MKINRYFPPGSNCLSHLLIPECCYKSYLLCRPHLSRKFFSPSVVASHVISPTVCSRLGLTVASSRVSRPGFITILLALSICSPQGCSVPRTPPWFSWRFLKAPVACHTEHQPPTCGRSFCSPYLCSQNWGLSTLTFSSWSLSTWLMPSNCACMPIMCFLVVSSIYHSWCFGVVISSCFFSVALTWLQC